MKKKRANKHGTGSAAKPKKEWALMKLLDFLNTVSSERRQVFFIHKMSRKIHFKNLFYLFYCSTQSNMGLPNEEVRNVPDTNNSGTNDFPAPVEFPETAAFSEGIPSPETPQGDTIAHARKRTCSNSYAVPKRHRNESRNFMDAIAARSAEREQLLQMSVEEENDETMIFFKSMGVMGKKLPRKLLAEAKTSVLKIMLDLQNRAAEDP